MNKRIITIFSLLLISIASCHKPDDPNGGENGGNGGNENNGGGNVTNIIPENAIAGKFSINPSEQVFFSKGNLLYSESTQTWSFAEHQYDYFGTNSFAFSEWIDLFDWNTNGAEHGSLSAWRPLTHQEWVYILDEKGNQVPIGVPGEICISSDFLSSGYYNQPDLSNVVFVDNPISDCDDNKRMYRTGDIGFYNFEGEVEII